ncbi:hypothetical protein E2562_006496 [Oryza meyeriana var. granulata]|uniref:Uncharacterized protein n=1 Tax=Oryza meyeriana var. granulata TaxID=110450 RepID=A0A6G1CML9_9ORYZ|nr:hypothetical protein E2562_006496 [Oryza meyeriana var. granulata]
MPEHQCQPEHLAQVPLLYVLPLDDVAPVPPLTHPHEVKAWEMLLEVVLRRPRNWSPSPWVGSLEVVVLRRAEMLLCLLYTPTAEELVSLALGGITRGGGAEAR